MLVASRSVTQRSEPLSVPSVTRFRRCSLCGVTKPHIREYFVLSHGYVASKCRSCNKFDQHARYHGLPLVKTKKEQIVNKKCTSCYITKPLESFHPRHKAGGTDRAAVCKQCRNEARRKPTPLKDRVPDGLKYCPGCSQAQLLDAFSKCSTWKDGLSIYCKVCASAKKRRYRDENPELVKSQEQASNERNREAKRERDHSYYWSNKEWADAQSRARYRENPEKYQQRARQYRKDNPEITRVRERNNRIRRDGAPGSHTFDETWQMLEDQDGLCAYCETPLFGNYQVDHMIPIVRGGSNDWSNLAITCAPCNGSKHASTAEEFMERLRKGL